MLVDLDEDLVSYAVERGYVSHECDTTQSVSMTLEYAYNDWCLARVAAALGHDDDAALFDARSRSYANHWNPKTGFMQPRTAEVSCSSPGTE